MTEQQEPTITIDRGIPLPTREWWNKYPFKEMQIGDSFLVDANRHSVKQAATHYALRNGNGFKVSIRKTTDGYRCWRIQ